MVYGTLDDSSLLEEESAKADIVLRMGYQDLINESTNLGLCSANTDSMQ
jgi:hypothetical protein